MTWLSGLKSARSLGIGGSGSSGGVVTILWLGNSIANLDSQDQASAFLSRFGAACGRRARLACRFVVSTDICQRDAKVLDAYDVQRPEYRDFLLNALGAANRVLGYDAFRADDWMPASWLDRRERNLHFYLTARRDVLVPLAAQETGGNGNGHGGAQESGVVAIRKGERVRVVTSGKWSEEAMGQVCRQAGFHIQHSWKDETGDYCEYTVLFVSLAYDLSTNTLFNRYILVSTGGLCGDIN